MNAERPSLSPRALADLLEREKRLDLQHLKVLGYPLWGLERFAYYERAVAERAPPLPNVRHSDKTRAARVRTSLSDLMAPGHYRGRDIWVLSSTQYRRQVSPGVYRCMFTGYLEQQFGDRILFLERNASALPSTQDPSVVFLDALLETATAAAAQLARPLARFVSPEARAALEPLGAERLAKNALIGRLFEGLAEAMVAALKPKIVFILCAYTRFVPFQRVLRRRGIPLIELQHGILHTGHCGYVFSEDTRPDYLPDHMLVFGERFGRVLEACSEYWRGRWSVGGHPWLAERAERAVPGAGQRGPVVFFSQPIDPVSKLLRTFLPAFRRALPPEIDILLKLHPRELNPEVDYADAIAAGVKIAARDADSYRLLAECRASVCVFSTLALEALAFPCASIVLRSELWTEEIRQFVADGTLLAADSPEHLAVLVQSDASVGNRSAVARGLFGLGEAKPDLPALLARLCPGFS